jgi:hypothetical protein
MVLAQIGTLQPMKVRTDYDRLKPRFVFCGNGWRHGVGGGGGVPDSESGLNSILTTAEKEEGGRHFKAC